MKSLGLALLMLAVTLSSSTFLSTPVLAAPTYTSITGSHTSPMHLTSGVMYVVTGTAIFTNSATLTIDPGVVIKFDAGAILQMDNAQLNAVGTVSDSIIFTSFKDDSYVEDTNGDGNATLPSPGDWGRIILNGNDTSLMEFCHIRYAGSGGYGAVRFTNAGNSTIRRCLVSLSGSSGIRVDDSSPEIVGNRLTACMNEAVEVVGTSSPTFYSNTYPGLANTFVGNQYDVVTHAGGLIGTCTWNLAGYPWHVLSTVTPNSGYVLTLVPGLIVKMAPGISFDSKNGGYATGQLLFVGTEADSIVITSVKDDTYGGDSNKDGSGTVPNPGDWGQLLLEASSTSSLKYCHIRYAGSGGTGAVRFSYSANSTIQHCLVSRSGSSGIRVDGSNPTIEYNTIDRTLNYGIYCSSSMPLIHYNSLAGDSTWYGVYTATTTDTIDATNNWWGSDSGPYDPSRIGPHYNPYGRGSRVSNYVDYLPWTSGLNPIATIYPGSISEDVLIGSTKQKDFLLVRNDGPAALIYTVHEANYFTEALKDSAGLTGKNHERIMQSALADIPWISISPTSGELPQGQSVTATLTFNASGLSEGTYRAYLVITSNDPEHDFAVIAITMNVGYVFAKFPAEDYSLLRGNNYAICWSAFKTDLNTVSIYLSSDNGRTYNTLLADNIAPNTSDYSWNVLQSVADSCKIMIKGYYAGGVERSGYSNEIFRIMDALPTDVTRSETPKSIVLQQNYPNPFNPLTNISFFLPQRTHVQLNVYSVDGRRVATLLDGYKSEGWHNLIWNGCEGSGASASSGIYFLRLQTGSSTITKKMILLR